MKIFIIALLVFSCGQKKSLNGAQNSKNYHWIDTDSDGLSDIEELHLGTDPFTPNATVSHPPESIDLNFDFNDLTINGDMSKTIQLDQLEIKRTWRTQILSLFKNKPKQFNKHVNLNIEPTYYVSLKEKNHHYEILRQLDRFDLNSIKKNDVVVTSNLPENNWQLSFNIKKEPSSKMVIKEISKHGLIYIHDKTFQRKYWEDIMKRNYRLIISNFDKEEVHYLNPSIKPESYLKNGSQLFSNSKSIAPGDTVVIANDLDEVFYNWQISRENQSQHSLLDTKNLNLIKGDSKKKLIVLRFRAPQENLFKIIEKKGYSGSYNNLKECKYEEIVFDKTITNREWLKSYNWMEGLSFNKQPMTQLQSKLTVLDDTILSDSRIIRFWLDSFHLPGDIELKYIINPETELGIIYPNSCRGRKKEKIKMKKFKSFKLEKIIYHEINSTDERSDHPTL